MTAAGGTLAIYLCFHWQEGDAGRGKAGKHVVERGEGSLRGAHHALAPALAPHVAARILKPYKRC
jgi:hypothetical protein